jgi:hypothetical protein
MKHRVINTVEYLTDDATYVYRDRAYYNHSDLIDFGGVDRPYHKFEYLNSGLQPGDEFLFGDPSPRTSFGNLRGRQEYMRAIPFENVKAGKIVTAQPIQYWKNNELVSNPYANYAHSIALEENDILDGTPIGGKIFVCFTETFWDKTKEYFEVDLNQDYWIDIAFENELITELQYNDLKNILENPTYLGADSEYESLESRTKKYWSFNGDYNFMKRDVEDIYAGTLGLLFGDTIKADRVSATRRGIPTAARARDALGRFSSGTGSSGSGGLFAQIKSGHAAPTMNVFAPNLLTRAFWWLSDRIRYTGLVYRSQAMTATISSPIAEAIPDHDNNINALLMISNASSPNPFGYDGDINVNAFPMYGDVFMPVLGKNVNANVFICQATMPDADVFTYGTDPILFKLEYFEPILYLRGDKII